MQMTVLVSKATTKRIYIYNKHSEKIICDVCDVECVIKIMCIACALPHTILCV